MCRELKELRKLHILMLIIFDIFDSYFLGRVRGKKGSGKKGCQTLIFGLPGQGKVVLVLRAAEVE